jgi:hypothetical protein
MRIVPATCGNINADELAEVVRRLSHDDPGLTSLTVSWSSLGDAGFEKIGDALRYNNYLVDLDVYSNSISSAGLARMGVALKCVLFSCTEKNIEIFFTVTTQLCVVLIWSGTQSVKKGLAF